MIKHQSAYDSSDDRETEMMTAKWNKYGIYHQFFALEKKKSNLVYANLVYTE